MSSKLCRFCLSVCNKVPEKIDKIILETMDILLLKMNMNITEDPTMCEECTEMLQKSFIFKSRSFYTEERIFDYTNRNENLVTNIELLDIYMLKESAVKLEVPVDEKICRFCMELVGLENALPLCEVDASFLQKCVPELNLLSINRSVICEKCYKFLEIYVKFIDKCAEVEHKIKKYVVRHGTNRRGKVILSKVVSYFDEDQTDFIKEDETEINDTINLRCSIEMPDLKIESPDCGLEHSDLILEKPDLSSEESSESLENSDLSLEKPNLSVEDPCTEFGRIRSTPYSGTDVSTKWVYTEEELKRRKYPCPDCSYRATLKINLSKHQKTHMNVERTSYRLEKPDLNVEDPNLSVGDSCTKYVRIISAPFSGAAVSTKWDYTDEELKRRKFPCTKCSYRANQKAHLLRHQITHMNAENKFYRHEKPILSVEDSRTKSVRRHGNSYSGTCVSTKWDYTEEELKTRKFPCSKCSYRAKQKRLLVRHQMTHMNADKKFYRFEKSNLRAEESSESLEEPDLSLEEPNVSVEDPGTKFIRRRFNPVCGANVSTKWDYTDEELKRRKFPCSRCSYRAIRKGHLLTHEKTHMNAENTFCRLKIPDLSPEECRESLKKPDLSLEEPNVSVDDPCTKSVRRRLNPHSGANISMKWDYTDEELKRRKFSCSRCSYRAVRKEHLLMHQERHLHVKRTIYCCTQCTYQCLKPTGLVNHINKRHKNHKEKPKCATETSLSKNYKGQS